MNPKPRQISCCKKHEVKKDEKNIDQNKYFYEHYISSYSNFQIFNDSSFFPRAFAQLKYYTKELKNFFVIPILYKVEKDD